MQNYTLCLLLKADLSEEERKKIFQDLEKTLNSATKPQVTQWGRRDLAYPVKKETQADYYLIDFDNKTTIPAILDRKLKLDERVLRFLVVKSKKKKEVKVVKEKKEKVVKSVKVRATKKAKRKIVNKKKSRR